eukprot:TRINITY_DN143_c0_g1_i14.p1 TRINITY_DN143_c0_g1~~TRINITY_DN143_c0_g1_i14.p1  ORF type:complete len:151 (+),score=18.29 TRINITY_DN143_c0_g1_i14:961-1413(+)
MFGLWMFGIYVHEALGQENFLCLYFTAGLTSSLCSHLWLSVLFRNDPQILVKSLGASGSIYGVFGAFYDLFPNCQLNIFGFVPMKIKHFVPAVTLYETIGLTGVLSFLHQGHAAHLGGLVFGYHLAKLQQQQHQFRIPSQRVDFEFFAKV